MIYKVYDMYHIHNRTELKLNENKNMKNRMAAFSPARMVGMLLNAVASLSPRLAGQIAFYLFGLPGRRKPKHVEQAFLATSDMHYETINGQRFAVYHWGFRGPVALLAHGWESHAGRWRKIAPLLVQAGYQVIAVDAPAHGRSQGRRFTMIRYADVLRALMQRHGPIDTVVAHSVGGASAIWAMGTISPSLRPRKAVILASFSALQTIMDAAQHKIGASPKLAEAVDAQIERVTGARTAHYSLTRMAEKLDDVDALLIHDRNDRVTPFRESERLHQAWPGARLLATAGFGHGLTAPEVNDAISEFVREEVAY